MGYVETNKETNLVKISTNFGDIIIKLDDKGNAPKTVSNFKNLVKRDFYNGIIFHRVIKDFMIQGGDPTGTGMSGSKETILGEFLYNGVKNNISHKRGVISMARTSMPNSASSQFFICHKDSTFLDGQYAAFGEVVEGIDVVDKIAELKTDYNDKPLTEAVITKTTFVEE